MSPIYNKLYLYIIQVNADYISPTQILLSIYKPQLDAEYITPKHFKL